MELDWHEKVYLMAFASFKSRYRGDKNYRRNMAKRITGISDKDYNDALASLIEKKILPPRGRIPTAGKKIIANIRKGKHPTLVLMKLAGGTRSRKKEKRFEIVSIEGKKDKLVRDNKLKVEWGATPKKYTWDIAKKIMFGLQRSGFEIPNEKDLKKMLPSAVPKEFSEIMKDSGERVLWLEGNLHSIPSKDFISYKNILHKEYEGKLGFFDEYGYSLDKKKVVGLDSTDKAYVLAYRKI